MEAITNGQNLINGLLGFGLLVIIVFALFNNMKNKKELFWGVFIAIFIGALINNRDTLYNIFGTLIRAVSG